MGSVTKKSADARVSGYTFMRQRSVIQNGRPMSRLRIFVIDCERFRSSFEMYASFPPLALANFLALQRRRTGPN